MTLYFKEKFSFFATSALDTGNSNPPENITISEITFLVRWAYVSKGLSLRDGYIKT